MEQKDLLQKNGQLQHHDVPKKIDDPKMMGNDFPMVHLDQQRWIPIDRIDWLELKLQEQEVGVYAAGYKDTTAAELQLLEDLLLSRG
ncbi:hypothetical protein Tco_0894912 [Tanacetum coccineum]|uniref:Uncharacterized protein n=1 Tax=Tanacetum coccineum TaxID=301880 RepID=A0ABQ5CD51_9ASTR